MDIGEATERYAAKLNGLPRATQLMDEDELAKYVEDLEQAKDELEVAWLEGLMSD